VKRLKRESGLSIFREYVEKLRKGKVFSYSYDYDFVVITDVTKMGITLFETLGAFILDVENLDVNDPCLRRKLKGKNIVATTSNSIEHIYWLSDVYQRSIFENYSFVIMDFASKYGDDLGIPDYIIAKPDAIAQWLMGKRGDEASIVKALSSLEVIDVSSFIDEIGRQVIAAKYGCDDDDDTCILQGIYEDKKVLKEILSKSKLSEKFKRLLDKLGLVEDIRRYEEEKLKNILEDLLNGKEVNAGDVIFLYYPYQVVEFVDWCNEVLKLPEKCPYSTCLWKWSYLILIMISIKQNLPEDFVEKLWRRYDEKIRDAERSFDWSRLKDNHLDEEFLASHQVQKRKVLMIDALRWDVAQVVKGRLYARGYEVFPYPRKAFLPSITEVGMNAVVCSKPAISYDENSQHFIVVDIDNDMKKVRSVKDRIAMLVRRGIVENEDDVKVDRVLDSLGENEAIEYIVNYQNQLVGMVDGAFMEGYDEVVIVTDHGFRVILDFRKEEPMGTGIKLLSRRFAVVTDIDPKCRERDYINVSRERTIPLYVVFPEDIDGVFEKQKEFAFVHGGNSIEERLVPILVVRKRRQVALNIIQKDSRRLVIEIVGVTEEDFEEYNYEVVIKVPQLGEKIIYTKGITTSTVRIPFARLLNQLKDFIDNGSITDSVRVKVELMKDDKKIAEKKKDLIIENRLL